MSVCTAALDKYIYFLLCAFAVVTCINHVIGNQILGVAVLIAILRIKQQYPKNASMLEYGKPLFVFFSVMFVSILLSPDMIKSLKEFWRYANRMVPFLLVLLFVKEKRPLLFLIGAFLFSMFINNLYAIYKGIVLISQGETYLRVTGFDSMVIMFSAYLLISLPILLILFFEVSSLKWKIFFLFFIAVYLTALFFNGTRMVWLILLFILPVIVWIYLRDLKKIIAVIFVAALVLGGMCYTLPFMQERVMSFSDHDNVSNQGHYLIMWDSIKMIKEHPLFGVGLGRFKKVFNEDYRSQFHIELEGNLTPHAHNNILTFWAETGIPGVIAYCYMFGSFLYYSGKQWLKTHDAPSLMFFMITLATVLQGITDYSFGLNQAMKIYFCMLAIYLNYRTCESKNDKCALI